MYKDICLFKDGSASLKERAPRERQCLCIRTYAYLRTRTYATQALKEAVGP
jgi:hypothetical protein